MGYKINNKDINLNKLQRIAQGKRGYVYRYDKNALKVLDDEELDECIDEETARYLTGMRTDRILLPKNLLFYNNTFKGYTLKLISSKPQSKNLISIPKYDFIRNVEELEEDIRLLSAKQVLLNGIDPKNTIFNGSLYLSDPSRYTIFKTTNTENLENLNRYQLYILLQALIVQELRKANVQNDKIESLKDLLEMKETDTECSKYFDEIIDKHSNIKQLVKRII